MEHEHRKDNLSEIVVSDSQAIQQKSTSLARRGLQVLAEKWDIEKFRGRDRATCYLATRSSSDGTVKLAVVGWVHLYDKAQVRLSIHLLPAGEGTVLNLLAGSNPKPDVARILHLRCRFESGAEGYIVWQENFVKSQLGLGLLLYPAPPMTSGLGVGEDPMTYCLDPKHGSAAFISALRSHKGVSLEIEPNVFTDFSLAEFTAAVTTVENQAQLELETELKEVAANVGEKASMSKANALVKVERYDAAVACLEELLALNPLDTEAVWSKGVALFHSGRFEEALECFDDLLKTNPDDFKFWTNKALVLFELGRPDDSLQCYERALELSADSDVAWYGRGKLLQSLGRFDDAISSYDKALELNPQFYEAWMNTGAICLQQHRYAEALNSYDQAVRQDSTSSFAWSGEGGSLIGLDRFAEALTCCEKACALDSNNYDAWYNRALAEENLGRQKEAVSSFERFLGCASGEHKIKIRQGAVEYARRRLGELKTGEQI